MEARAVMLLWIFRQPCCLVAWSDFFFAGIAILGRFLAQPDSPRFTGFSFSLSCPPLREKENPVNPGLSGWAKKRPKMAIPAKKKSDEATRQQGWRNIRSNALCLSYLKTMGTTAEKNEKKEIYEHLSLLFYGEEGVSEGWSQLFKM